MGSIGSGKAWRERSADHRGSPRNRRRTHPRRSWRGVRREEAFAGNARAQPLRRSGDDQGDDPGHVAHHDRRVPRSRRRAPRGRVGAAREHGPRDRSGRRRRIHRLRDGGSGAWRRPRSTTWPPRAPRSGRARRHRRPGVVGSSLNTPDAKEVVDEFLARQREMYAGGDLAPVAELLDPDVVWHVPGTSPIAGDYRGRDGVLGYFRLRRELAGGSIRISKQGESHHSEALVQLADGRASLGGEDVVWRTAGVYRVAGGKIAEAWLVPLDSEHFDRVWAATRPEPFVYTQRVRPQECAASKMLGHPRFLEFFEAAFIECWRERFGSLDESLGPARALTVAAVDVPHLRPVRGDDELRIEVVFDRLTERSIQVHYDAFVKGVRVADASSRYVCLDAESGEPTSL